MEKINTDPFDGSTLSTMLPSTALGTGKTGTLTAGSAQDKFTLTFFRH